MLYGLFLHSLPCKVCLQAFHGSSSNLVLDCNVSFVKELNLSHFFLVALEPEAEEVLGPFLEQVLVDVAMVDLVPDLILPCLQGASHQATWVVTSEDFYCGIFYELDTSYLVEAQSRLRVAQ